MTAIVDLRCPGCSRPVVGREDVVARRRLPAVPKTCPGCKARVRLAPTAKGDVPPDWHVVATDP